MAQTVRTVISPGRYVQGKGAIHQLGEYLKNLGSTPLIVADDLVWGLVAHDVEDSLKAADLPVHREKFNGIPSAGEVDRLVGVIEETKRRYRDRDRRREHHRRGQGVRVPGRYSLGQLPDGRVHRCAV